MTNKELQTLYDKELIVLDRINNPEVGINARALYQCQLARVREQIIKNPAHSLEGRRAYLIARAMEPERDCMRCTYNTSAFLEYVDYPDLEKHLGTFTEQQQEFLLGQYQEVANGMIFWPTCLQERAELYDDAGLLCPDYKTLACSDDAILRRQARAELAKLPKKPWRIL